MPKTELGEHTSHRFDDELENLRGLVMRAGGLVEAQLDQALEALERGDLALAERVIAADQGVNDLELEIDAECAQIMAIRAPVARDLRFVLSTVKAVADLERMGDEAVRIARMAARLAKREGDARGHRELRHLGRHVQGMLRSALDAFARMDVEVAVAVLYEDRSVDREYESLTRELITFMMEDPRVIPRSLDVMFAARALERIGDRACNLSEYVIYYVRGTDVRHADPDQILAG